MKGSEVQMPNGSSAPLVGAESLEHAARARLDDAAADFIAGGAGREVTLRANEAAWSNFQLWPRVMVNVRDAESSVSVDGQVLAAPLLVSPMGLHQLASVEAEIASATAARRAGVGYVASSAASVTLEEIADVGPAFRWFQLYWLRDRDVVADLVRRAQGAGYTGLCLTVDAPVGGARLRDRRNRFTVPEGIRFANLERYGFAPATQAPTGRAVRYIVDEVDASITWQDLKWLKELSDLPLVVKGVLHPDDAVLAGENGADAVFISNHGGRQLDQAPPTAHALARIGSTGSRRIVVDGGVRDASAIAVAISLGATLVGIGRPVLWALAVDGVDGATQLLSELCDDFRRVLALLGMRSPDELRAQRLVSGPHLDGHGPTSGAVKGVGPSPTDPHRIGAS